MAFERFARDAREAVVAATQEEAQTTGRGLVEAEHLLLALVSRSELRKLGLDHDGLLTALAREEDQSLAAVGIATQDFPASIPRRRPRKPRLATSTRLALERALTIAAQSGDRRIGARHLLLGVLAAEQGRVPRALQLAGIDVRELRARI
jgi:ATP-dependent Clp protease ATP-binding subunit ClpA